jgi:hypothetical protein
LILLAFELLDLSRTIHGSKWVLSSATKALVLVIVLRCVFCCPHFFLLFDVLPEWFNSKLICSVRKHLDEFGVTDKLFVGISKGSDGALFIFYLSLRLL